MTFSLRTFFPSPAFMAARKGCKENLMKATEPARSESDVTMCMGEGRNVKPSKQPWRHSQLSLLHSGSSTDVCFSFPSHSSPMKLFLVPRLRLFSLQSFRGFIFHTPPFSFPFSSAFYLFIKHDTESDVVFRFFLPPLTGVDGMWCDVCCEWINYNGRKIEWAEALSKAKTTPSPGRFKIRFFIINWWRESCDSIINR